MKNFKYYLPFCLVLFFSPFLNVAQENNLHFEHINYDVNFSQSTISSIYQTKLGFIWIGTSNGLIRYDGYNFLQYVRDKNKKGTISNNHINTIFEDHSKNLWIGTNNGLNLFDKSDNNFVNIDIPPIKGGRNYISTIIEDSNRNIWVGTFGGVKRLDTKTRLLKDISTDPLSLFKTSRVLSLYYDNNYGVLVGTSKGILAFDPKNGSQKKLPQNWLDNVSFLKSKVTKIIKQKNGDLWFGTEANGVFRYSTKSSTLTNFVHNFNSKNSLPSNWVTDILEVDENTIWFATKDGLCVFKKDKEEFSKNIHNPLNTFSLSDNEIKCLLKDRLGSIWLGTVGGGLNFYHKTNNNFIDISETTKPNFGLNTSLVNSINKDINGSLWVGTYGGGLNYLDFKNNLSANYLIDNSGSERASNIVTSLVDKNQDILLCGTFNGLYEFNKKSKTFRNIPLSSNTVKIADRPINSLLTDKGLIWVATNGSGLKKIKQNGGVDNYLADGRLNSISDNFITDIEDRNSFLWVATQDGLNYFDKKTNKVLKVYRNGGAYSLANNSLTVLFTDSKKRLWVGADYDGLNYFDEKTRKFYVINKSLGFTDETIKSINEDSQGNLWVTANDLLFRIKIKNFKPPFKSSDLDITTFSSKDGLKVKQFSNNCSLKLNNNQLVFGSSKGLTIFNPLNIIKTQNESEIVLTKLIVNNEEIIPGNKNFILKNTISETSEITLNHSQTYIDIEFSALNFINAVNNRYSYKLERSFSKDDWHDIGSQHNISLIDLSSGTYELSIKTSNEEGLWNPSIKTIKITVLPPWWRTWWAYVIYFILLLIASKSLYQFVLNRENLKSALILEQVEKERQLELYNMKLEFFTNVSHEIRTPLTLISGPVEELLNKANGDSNLEKKLKIIKSNSDRLLKLVNELMDFRKAEKGSMKIYCEQQDIIPFCFDIYESFRGIAVEKQIDYKFVINSKSILLYFDKNQMEKVIYNLLSNAFKFTNNKGRITLAIEQNDVNADFIQIKIKDNGIGIPENRKKKIFKNFFQLDDRGSSNVGSGIGLALSKSIVALHHGELNVQKEADTTFNTIFTITLKKGKDHLKKAQIVENSISLPDFASSITDSKSEIIEKIEEDIFENESAEGAALELSKQKYTLVIIDDNQEVLSFVFDVLCEDYRVLTFTNATDALESMEKEIPDLIISDVMMPEMDGFELCKILKTSENTNHIPVILLTAKSSTLNRIEGLSTGADTYISKPFSIEILKLSIVNLLSSKEIMRKKYSQKFIGDSSEIENLETPEGVFLKKLTQIVSDNIDNPNFDVNDLVKEIGMSRTVLYKKVQTITNYSVASFIKNLRLKRAAYLLINSSFPISEITYMVGFNDRKHFSKEFKKLFNVSPTVFKVSQDNNS